MTAWPRGRPFAQLAALIAAAAAGGGALGLMGVPAGWLSGAMLGVAALAAAGGASPLPAAPRQVAILLAGVGMGCGLTPSTLHTLSSYPVSLALLAAAIFAMTAASYLVLLRSPGFNRKTAFYSAVPGALSYVFIVAADAGADMSRLAVIQVFRIFVLMAIIPIVARAGLGAPTFSFATDPVWMTVALVVGAAVIAVGLKRIRVANAELYAGILISALAHVLGWAPGRLSPGMQIIAQTLVGAWIGTRFIGFDWTLLHRMLIAAATSFLAAFLVATGFAWVATRVIDAPFAETLAAFAPGGLEAMTMMAFALGLDPLFVGAHHLARFFMLSLALPIVAKRFGGAAP